MAIDWNKARGSDEEEKKKKSTIDWEKAGAYTKDELKSSSSKKTTTSNRTTSQSETTRKKTSQEPYGSNRPTPARTGYERHLQTSSDYSRKNTQTSAEVKKVQEMTDAERQNYFLDYTNSKNSSAEVVLENQKKKSEQQKTETKTSVQDKVKGVSNVVGREASQYIEAKQWAERSKAVEQQSKLYETERLYNSLDEDDYALLDSLVLAQEETDYANTSYFFQAYKDPQSATRDNTTAYTDASTKAWATLRDKGYTDEDITKLMRYRSSLKNAEVMEKNSAEYKEMAKEHPILASGISVFSNLASPAGIVEVARAKATDTPVDPNSPWFGATQMTSDIRGQVMEDKDWNIGVNKDGESWDAFDFVYGAGMSAVDSVVASSLIPGVAYTKPVGTIARTLTSVLGGSVVGSQAMTSTMQDVARRGGSTDQVIKSGITAYLAETLSEAWSIGNFKGLQESGKRGLKNLALDILKSAGVNASEEAVTEAVNIVYDRYALGEKSNYEMNVKAYMQTQKEDGTYYSREEAEKLAWNDALKQIAESALSGAFQGLLMGGTGNIKSRATQYYDDVAIGKTIKQSGETDSVIEEARQSNDKAVQEWVQRIDKSNKKTNKSDKAKIKDADLGGAFRALVDADKQNVTIEEKQTEDTRITPEEKVEITNPTLKKEDGKVVSVASVEDVKGGEISVKDSNGDTQVLDTSALSEKAKKLWSYASEHFTDAQSIQGFVDSYTGGSVDTYSRIYKGVFDLASTGLDAKTIRDNEIFSLNLLGEKAFNSAVESGHTAMSYKAGVVDLTTLRKSNSQKLTMRIADSFGKKHNMNVVFVDSLGTKEGFLRKGKNQIVIALDASSGAISRTLGHETFHYLETEDNEKAKQISDFVINTMTRLKGADWVESRYAFYEKQGYKTREEQISEFVADQMFDVFANERAVNEFVQQDRTFAQKVLDHIKGLIAEIKGIYKKLVATGQYEDIAAWEEDLQALEKLNNIMLDALSNIEQKRKTEQKTEKNTSDEVVRATKRVYDYSKSFSQQVDDYLNGLIPKSDTLVIGGTPKIYQDIGFNALPMTINTTHIDYALYGTKDSDHFLGEKALKQLPQKIESPIAVFVSNTKGTTSVIALLDFSVNGKRTIVPIVIDGFGKNNNVVIDSNALTSVYGKKTAVDQLYNAIKQEASGMFSLLYVNKKEASALLHRTGHQLSGTMIPRDGFYHSIRENNSPVKPKLNNVTESVQFKKWFGDWQNHPKTASKIVNADGTPKIMYHGTPNQFTVFDKKKAKSSGYYGRGFYFTDSKSHSSHYGNAMAVYLDVKNPLEQGKNHISKKQLRNFLEAVAENEDDYDIWNYGTEDIDEIINNIYKDDAFAVIQDVNATAIGDLAEAIDLFNKVNKTNYDGVITPTETVVYKPTQIKSAADNIGIFDKDNPDIRFSTKRLVEETKDLIAVHNLSYDKITDALKLGGLPMPSIAVLKAKQGHNKYGDISVVFNKNTISPEIDSRNKVYVADAYSPTFPNVRIKANKEKAQRLANVLKTSVAGVESNIIDRNENEIVRKAASQHQLQRKYVEDNGIKIDGNKEPTFTNRFHKRMTDFIIENDITWEKLINDKKLQDEYIQKVTESTPSFRREKAVSEIKAIFENDFLIHNDAIINSFNTDFEIAKGNVEPSFDEWTYLHNIREHLTDNSNPYGYNEDYIDFVKGYTDGIVDKTEIYTGEDTFLESGEPNPNAYKDYTAENVVDVMKSQKHQNGGGIGYLRALLAQQFESIEDIRSNKNRLVTEAEFNEKADKLNDKFTKIASMGAEFNKGVGLWNITHDTFVQAIENGATRRAMIDALNDNGFRWVKGDFVDKCMEFIEELKATPTEYFEAKPERVVEFNEIAFVVIPDNAPAKLVETLNERGIETRTYTAGDEADRVRALNSDESVLFSTKRESAIEAYWAETVRENHSFRNILSLLGEMELAGNKTQLDTKDIDRIAKDIIRSSSSKYDVSMLSDKLAVIYDYMANGEYSDNEEIYVSLLNLANDVLNQSERIDKDLYDQYEEIRKYIKDTPIYISPNVKQEIESQFGSYNTFRRMLMGKAMRFTIKDTGARSLDEVWQELSGYDEGRFPRDTNELDMPIKLVEFFEAISPKIYNPYAKGELTLEDDSVTLALDMYQQFYLKVKRLEDANAKQRNLMYENMRKIEESKKALVEDFKRKAELNFEEYKKRLAEYREQREIGDRKRVYRNEFNRSFNYISRRLERETDKDHIPENLKELASAFVKMIPDSNQMFSESKIARFENEYRKLEDSTSLFDEDMPQRISALAKRIASEENGMPRMRDLDIYEIDELKNIANHIKYIVQAENYLFSEKYKVKVEDFANKVHNELSKKGDSRIQGVPDKKYFGRSKDKMVNSMDAITRELTKPEYLFSNLGSETLYNLYKELRKGENVEGHIIETAKDFEVETKKKYKYDLRWDNEDVTIDFGRRKLKITIAEAMALYATSKRNQGLQHMLGGGVVIYAKEDVQKTRKLSKKVKTKEKIQKVKFVFTPDDITILHKSLTKSQKDYADTMVGYITNDVGAERNSVSMTLNGIEKYKEPYYFPIKVDKDYIDANLGRQEVVSTIQNQSSAKRTNKYANNPIEIKNFNDMVNEHIYDSALYCAYAIPINDFKRVFNFRDKEFVGEGVESLMPQDISIQNDIKRANGINTVKQIKEFMVALDSGSRYENLPSFSARMTSKMKKASTMASLSVVVQQPTAVFRAMLYIDPKYFATWATKKDIEEMRKYNGCALKKKIGYFDVNMGRTATDYLDEYSPKLKELKGFSVKELVKNSDIKMRVDQLAGWGAEKADEMTWGAIWNACKKQVKANDNTLEGDALNEAAAELFQDVIAKTQVYDSVFTKPDYMRRKEGFAMMTTSFMSEPLTTLNMLVDAVVNTDKSKESKAMCARAFGCFVTSLIVNNILKGLVYSIRDGEEDESYLEKLVSNVLGGTVDDVFGMFPHIRDIVELLKGYDLTRMDTQAFSTLINSVKVILDDDKSGIDKVLAILKSVGQFTGVPAYNVARDVKSIIGIAQRIKNGIKNGFEPTTSKGVLYEIQEAFEWIPGVPDAPNLPAQVIEAHLNGDKAHYDKQWKNMLEKYKGDEKEVNKQIKTALGKMYKEDKISKSDAEKVLKSMFDMKPNDIHFKLEEWEADLPEGQSYSKYSDFVEAVKSGKNLQSTIVDLKKHGVDKEDLSRKITSEFKKEYLALLKTNPSQARTLKQKLLNAYVAAGYDRKEKEKDIDKWIEQK